MKRVFEWLRWHRIGRLEAIEIARQYAEARGWPWEPPINVMGGLCSVTVVTYADHRGGNVYVRLSARTGRVLKGAFANR